MSGTTRFALVVPLPTDRKAHMARHAIASKFVELLEQLRRSLMWNWGKEIAAHSDLKVATDVAVYICDPRSLQQRCTSENTNELLRKYLPRSFDLVVTTGRKLDQITTELSERPHKTPG